jgi:hypothetical protein
MSKLKEVRALKSTGVEPLAPTLIKRVLHNLVLKAEDRRWASEIGRLSMLGELTARQTSAAYHVGEIYGRFEWLHGRRRSAASPSYEIGRGRGVNGHDHSQDAPTREHSESRIEDLLRRAGTRVTTRSDLDKGRCAVSVQGCDPLYVHRDAIVDQLRVESGGDRDRRSPSRFMTS